MPSYNRASNFVTIGPSILSANFGAFADAASLLDKAGAQALHIDIMDGHFVPNLTFGPQLVKDIRPVTNAFLDVHLMVEHPEQYFAELAHAGAQMATIHPEATYHLDRAISEIKAQGMEAGVALNPATPIEACEWVLESLDRVLVMTVNPGFGGQKFIERMTDKIKRLTQLRDKLDLSFEIAVDGGVSETTAHLATSSGATFLVAGSSVFAHAGGPAEGYKALQALVSGQ